jgi:hypothetical protein
MKTRLSQVYLEQQTAPKIVENDRVDWIEYGEGEYRNQYPQFLIDLYNSSATHSAIVNATSEMIAGQEIVIEDTGDLSNQVELKQFFANINGKGQSVDELLKKTAFDLKLHGAYAWNIIWNVERTKIVQVHHIPVEKVRSGKPDALGNVKCYYVSNDWTKIRQKQYAPHKIDAFDTNNRTSPNAIYYHGLYTVGMDIYHTPDYVASTNWILTDNLTRNFHLANIQNGFSPSFWINFNNGVPTDEERFAIENQIQKKFTGAGNAGKFVLTFSDDANTKPDLQPIQLSDADKQYTVLNELCIQNIMIGHRVTSPMLLGVKTDGQLGGRNEILEAYELYSNTVIAPYQEMLLKSLKMVCTTNNLDTNITIKNLSPLNSMFDADILADVLTEDEIRAELGYAPKSQVLQEEKERAQKEELAKTQALDYFIANYGEEEDLDNWELLSEEEINPEDEHEEFDFEHNLNALSNKISFARVGEARKRGSSQDGYDEDFNLYRVRYSYSGKTKNHKSERKFCKKMVAANKIYRKEDIIGQKHSLSSIAANKGFGPNGSDVYNIWLYKGGPNCHHRWMRKIYVTKFGNKPNYDTDELINKTKARARGFKPESNDQRVYQAPIDMPNRGYLK